ncbi:MAG TPA: endo-1,4-beta-xylanase [Anaeromyxobacter sp.]
MTNLRSAKAVLGLAAVLAAISACDRAASPNFEISPMSSDLAPGESITFSAVAQGEAVPVAWSVQQPGGGTIDSAGTYSAPDAEGTYTVVASAAARTSTANVRVRKGVRVTVNPSAATIPPGSSLALAATVTGAGGVNTVTWSVDQGSAGGSVTAAGVYTAPQTAGAYTVTATSTVDATRSGQATITVTAPAPPPPAPVVAIAVAPSTASMQAGATLQFSASVTGSSDTGVAWSVAETTGGAVSTSGLYTAPATPGTYHVVATSHADPSKTSSATVAVTAVPTPTPPPSTSPPATTLRDAAARHGLIIGMGWGPPPWSESNAIASTQFGAYMLPGSVGMIWKGPGQYDWSMPDYGVQYAAQNPGFRYNSNQLFYGIFVGQGSGSLVPTWLRGPDSSGGYGAPTVSADQLSQLMHDFLTAYVQRYGTGSYRTEIANELVSSPGSDWYFQNASIGAAGGRTVAQYVDQLARWAKAANPDVKLYLNETRNEDSVNSFGTANPFGDLVRTLQAMGTPLDGLGFQCHEFIDRTYDYTSIQGVFAYFASLGYDLHITEMGMTAPVDGNGLVSATDQALQAARYQSLIRAFIAGGGARAKSIAIWGISDRNAFDVGGLLWDVNLQPKADFQAVLDTLNQ